MSHCDPKFDLKIKYRPALPSDFALVIEDYLIDEHHSLD